MSDTSLAAFKRANVTAGQRRIIECLRNRPRLRPTRQELADLLGMKLQTVTPRVNELIHDFDPPWIRELPVRDGAHPLELVEHDYTPREARTDTGPYAVEPHGEESGASPRNPEAKRVPVWVTPVFEHHRMSMTVEQAKRLLAHPRAADAGKQFFEAQLVASTGRRHWVDL